MGLFNRKRYVVTNLFVALDETAFGPILQVCAEAQGRIVEHDEDFEVAPASWRA